MSKFNQKKTILYNVAISIAAQAISLLTSFIINLIVPKYIDVFQYAYWQTYVLYASYSGIFHLGILDGIMLRYSQFDYNELDKSEIKSQAIIIMIILSTFAVIGIIFSNFVGVYENSIIVALVSLSIIVKNAFVFSSYIFQCTNRIKNYAKIVIIQKMFFAILCMFMVFSGVNSFIFYCVADLVSEVAGFVASIPLNIDIFKAKHKSMKSMSGVLKATLLGGSMLMIANLSNNLIIGSTKIFIQKYWDTLSFGKVSFGFSITNLFLTFVTSISVVLFPSMKRMKTDDLPKFYRTLRDPLTLLLIIILACYYPIQYILNIWIPKYNDSLIYLGYLLPIIICTTRTSLLTNNYFKAYRCEKSMLLINVGCIILEWLGLYFIYRFVNNLNLILIWTVILTYIKSILSEIKIYDIININFYKDIIFEIIIVIIFVIGTQLSNHVLGFVIYCFVLIIYCFMKKDIIKNIIGFILNYK